MIWLPLEMTLQTADRWLSPHDAELQKGLLVPWSAGDSVFREMYVYAPVLTNPLTLFVHLYWQVLRPRPIQPRSFSSLLSTTQYLRARTPSPYHLWARACAVSKMWNYKISEQSSYIPLMNIKSGLYPACLLIKTYNPNPSWSWTGAQGCVYHGREYRSYAHAQNCLEGRRDCSTIMEYGLFMKSLQKRELFKRGEKSTLEWVGHRPKIELHGYPPWKWVVNRFCSLRKKDCSGI